MSSKLPLLFTLFCAVAYADPRVLHVRTFGEPLTLDWNRAFTPVEATLVRNLQEGLVSIGLNGKKIDVKPALAEKWSISSDGKTYTFSLRKNVKWSDGTSLKAQDFVASWKRLLSPSFNGNYAYLLFDIENAEAFHQGKLEDFNQVGVKATNEHQLQVKLRAPIAYWIWIPTFWSTFPVRQDQIDKHGSLFDRPGKLVNLGPFLLDSHDARRKIVLKKNPTYYGKRGNVDEIIAALVEDDMTATKLYEDGQLDFVTKIPSTAATRLKTRPDFQKWQEARVAHLDFNPNQAPTNDVRIRKAIAMAIDRNRISKLIESASQPATSLVPPSITGYSPKSGLGYNPEMAKQLLVSALKENPWNMTLDLITVGFADEVLIAQAIQEDLKKNLGIKVEMRVFEPKQYYSPAVNLGGFALLLNRWTADFPDPDNFFSIFLSGAGNNRVQWKNANYDEIVIKARSITDAKKREQEYQKAQRLLLEDEVIAMPLYYGQNCALVNPNIRGFQHTPTNSYLFKDFSLK